MDNDGQEREGGGVKKFNILPDVLCEWPLMRFINFTKQKLPFKFANRSKFQKIFNEMKTTETCDFDWQFSFDSYFAHFPSNLVKTMTFKT